jgi:hypothetical protein
MPVIHAASALLLQQVAIDSAAYHQFRDGGPQEPPPLPGGITVILRTIFNAPSWVWALGLVIGIAVAIGLARFLWLRRAAIGQWLTTRDRGAKAALAGSGVLIVVLLTWMGVSSWNYMQHDNAFCVGCHIMEGPWNKFASDAGKHSDLECHDNAIERQAHGPQLLSRNWKYGRAYGLW